MGFVRIKRISGKEYGYYVNNSWTPSGPRQKVSQYLGRVIRTTRAKSEGFRVFLGLTDEDSVREWINKNSFRDILLSLLKLELSNHSIPDICLKIEAEKIGVIDEKGKQIVYALNEGFLCSYTAKKLLEYDPSIDYSGYNLADALTAAGIAAEKDIFISLFGKMQAIPKKQVPEQKKQEEEFYY
jgi:hypothetical protein